MLKAPSLGLPTRALHNYAVAATPSGFVALGGGTIGAGHSMTEKSWVVLVHNANVTARLVVGLSMCGLRGDDVVRLKRLKPPWINATAANTPPRRALASAPHV